MSALPTTTARRLVLGGASVALAVAGMMAPASAHAATARNGVCEVGEFCYSFNSGFTGSVSDFGGTLDDYGASQPSCYEFISAGNGKGICVKNNAASAWNRTNAPVTVHFNSGNTGPAQVVAPGARVDLNSTLKNQNASHQFGGGSTNTGGCSTAGLGDPHTCDQALAWMKARINTQSSDYYRQCDHTMGRAYGFANSGSATAAVHWTQIPASYKHPGNRNVPAGALAFFTGGSAGHVMMSLGNGQFVSTDIPRANYVGTTTIEYIENHWHKTYAGWSQPWFKTNH